MDSIQMIIGKSVKAILCEKKIILRNVIGTSGELNAKAKTKIH